MIGFCILVMLAGATVCAVLADNKNRNVAGWFLGGALVPLIAVLILAAATPLPNPAGTMPGY